MPMTVSAESPCHITCEQLAQEGQPQDQHLYCVHWCVPQLYYCASPPNLLVVIYAWSLNLSLTELNLSHNKLSVLPDSIVSLVHLKSIDLSHNQIALFPHELCSLPALEAVK